MKKYWKYSKEQLRDVFSTTEQGLSEMQVKKIRETCGENILEEGKRPGLLRVFLSQFADLLIVILLIAALISMFSGNAESTIVIAVVLVMNAVLGTVQHQKAEKSLDSLKNLSAPCAKVIREGKKKEIPSRELVPGDLVELEAGDMVVADGRILDNYSLQVNESALTGESTNVEKTQGSLPEDVQNAFYRSIKGFENIEIMRPAYAIEYDCVDPTSLEATLESKVVRGLYGAGQFNGTSGYEEAAAQGLLAGLNAARNALGESQLILPRQSSYLGTLVDDLVTKGVMDPYRMMTSRSEYRLTLRQDNADTRLTPIGREYGLVQDDRWTKYQQTQAVLDAERRRLHDAHLRTADLRAAMEAAGLAPAAEGGIAEELLRRPEINYPLIAGMIGWGEGITPMLAERLETEIKYAGYIARQDRMIREVARHEKTLIPEDFSYTELTGLTLEAREKLARIRPKNLGQAGRIPGVSPSDVAQLSIALAANKSKA